MFRKRDFFSDLAKEGEVDAQSSKRASKMREKEKESDDYSSEEVDPEQKTKTVNSMNKMLPSVRQAHEEVKKLEKQKNDSEEPAAKRMKVEGLKKFYEN